jgi:N-acetyl-anhydromuramyl-L-alanine amidase AmpD
MRALFIPDLRVSARRHSRVLGHPLAVPRAGVMLHYDDSSRDDWALAWFSDPRCTNGYTWLVLDDGSVIELADPALRTPHAGPCLTPNANSAFYGVAATTNGLVPATPAQLEAMIAVCAALFRFHEWPATSVRKRIVGHDRQAIWTARHTTDVRLWGRLGRKVDPTGRRADARPILDVDVVRRAVAVRLRGAV